MTRRIRPAHKLLGTTQVPGDKSISHRYAMLGAIAMGKTEIRNFAGAADCRSTLDCLRRLGVALEVEGSAVTIEGQGLYGLRAPSQPLDAGNSGSTLRMLSGILAAQHFHSEIAGDDSLNRRPMRRIIDPLTQMGARIRSREGGLAPLAIEGGTLAALEYVTPIPSAQIKSAVLLAGLYAGGCTRVRESSQTRDHTEIALREFGAQVEPGRLCFGVHGGNQIRGMSLHVPGDISSAAFFLVAALLFPESNLTLLNVGLNPTRTAILDFLVGLGADISLTNIESQAGELVGDVHVRGGRQLGAVVIDGSQVPALIDELPVLCVLGACTGKGVSLSGAAELRVKESDRIAVVAENLRRMGVEVKEKPDGLEVSPGARLHGAVVASHGDHRIAMAFAVAALKAGDTAIDGADCAQVSFPGFYEALEAVVE